MGEATLGLRGETGNVRGKLNAGSGLGRARAGRGATGGWEPGGVGLAARKTGAAGGATKEGAHMRTGGLLAALNQIRGELLCPVRAQSAAPCGGAEEAREAMVVPKDAERQGTEAGRPSPRHLGKPPLALQVGNSA